MELQRSTHRQHAAAVAPGGGDLDRLYRDLSPRLERIVRRAVRCSDATVEDACQCAWSRLVQHRTRVRPETAFGWLARTAVHEALRLDRRSARDASLEDALERGLDPADTAPELWEQLAGREQIARVRELAARPQRFVWLRALGWSYAEMAAHERCTLRTVDRQLSRARRELEGAAAW
jgi:RNA polymerase sigma factor (sigma-70 family)